MEHSPPDVSGRARLPRVVLGAHPFARLQLSTSELPGKHRLSTADKFRDEFAVLVVFWNKVDVPDTNKAGNVASCSNDGGEFDVDSDSHGLGLTSPDNLETINLNKYACHCF